MSDFRYPLHEECGVFGIYDKAGTEDVAAAAYAALYALQHRGQESCGIAVNVDGVITGHRDIGLVNEVFTPAVMASLPAGGKMATGHVRYATAGTRGPTLIGKGDTSPDPKDEWRFHPQWLYSIRNAKIATIRTNIFRDVELGSNSCRPFRKSTISILEI